jgi:uncharacterized protein YigA (DUF484 family)
MTQHKDQRKQAVMPGSAGAERQGEDPIAAYLRDHPDFFVDRAELLQAMTPPSQWSGDTVVDMQRYMMQSLRGEIAGLRDCANEVIETSRANLATQSRTHASVLVVIAAQDISALVRAITDDLPILLDVDVCLLSVEPGPNLEVMIGGIGRLGVGDVDRFIGPGRDVSLQREMADDGLIFGAGAGLVRSAALARVRCGEQGQVGMLAFGSRREGAFHPRQGTELLRFLSKVVEACLCRLIPLAPGRPDLSA